MGMYVLTFVLGVIVTYLLLTYVDGREKHTLTRQHDQLKQRVDAFIKTQEDKILRDATFRKEMMDVKFKVECLTGKIEAESELSETEISGLKQMCINMRNEILDVKNIAVSKRVVNRVIFDATAIELVKPGFDPATMKKVKSQLKEVSK